MPEEVYELLDEMDKRSSARRNAVSDAQRFIEQAEETAEGDVLFLIRNVRRCIRVIEKNI